MTDNFLLLGFANALLMILGLVGIGSIIIKCISKYISQNSTHIFSGCEFLIGVIFLSINIAWFSLLFTGPLVYQIFSLTLDLAGIFSIIKFAREFHGVLNTKIITEIPKVQLGFYLILSLLYLLCNSADVTNADSIDYHVGYALNYLQPFFDSHPEWYNGRMASIGEKINAIGLSVGSPQFGPLLQFSGYISMGYILGNSFGKDFNDKYLVVLALLSSPVFLFLGISAKPQLLPTAFSFLSFYLVFMLNKIKNFSIKDAKIIIFTALLLSSVAFTHKFSFLISYFFICIFLIWTCKNLKINQFFLILLGGFSSLLVISPAYLDKHLRYESSLFEYFLNPVSSSLPSFVYFIESARQYRENHFPFPVYLLLPDSLGTISTVLGIGVIFAAIPLLINGVISNFLRILILLYISILALFSMPSSRFFLEPYVWLLIGLVGSEYKLGLRFKKILRFLIYLQTLFVITALLPISMYASSEILGFGVNAFKEKFVNGYSLTKWYSKKLAPSSSILLDHRSSSLSNRNIVSLEVHEFAKHDLNQYRVLQSQLNKYAVTYVVTVDRSPNFLDIEKCASSQIFGPERLNISTRNPFNSGYENGYIFRIEANQFVECLILKGRGSD